MQIAVCDDDPEELVRISSILEEYRQERKASLCYRAFPSATELLSTAKSGAYDLYLLDVMMPAVSGMEAARELRGFDSDAALVFLTSSPEFAVESYRYKAQDYLLKPARREQLFSLLDTLLATRQGSGESLSVKTKTGVTRILLERLAYVEAMGRLLSFHLSECARKGIE